MNCGYRWCEVEETYVAARDDEQPATIVVRRAVLLTTETECDRTLSVSMIASGVRPDPHGLIEISSDDGGPPKVLFALSPDATRRLALGALDGFESMVRNTMTRTQHERARNRRAAAERDLLLPPAQRYLPVVGGDGARQALPKGVQP